MLSDVYMRLGDLNLYNECYNESYAEYRECLAIRQRVCSADDRSVMEANFIAGMAKLYGGDRDTALAHFRSAAQGCKLRIAREQEKGGDAGTPFQQILKDIEERIEEEETAVGAVNMSAFRQSLLAKVSLPGFTDADVEEAEELAPTAVVKRSREQAPPLKPQVPADEALGSVDMPSPAKRARIESNVSGVPQGLAVTGGQDADLF